MPDASPLPAPDFAALRMHLRRLRNERGWSLDELAARSGVGRSTLSSLESGKSRRNPNRPASNGTLHTWYCIARALDVDLGELLYPLYGAGHE